ncbi:MAG: hypothetical protein HZB46_12945 [Solirubrobacterales bacterium]|nr:hypothetical protein [Solirubrobacterales bacterium]
MTEVLIGAAGCVATLMVIVGMILITPRGTEPVPARPSPDDAADPQTNGVPPTREAHTAPPVG